MQPHQGAGKPDGSLSKAWLESSPMLSDRLRRSPQGLMRFEVTSGFKAESGDRNTESRRQVCKGLPLGRAGRGSGRRGRVQLAPPSWGLFKIHPTQGLDAPLPEKSMLTKRRRSCQ